VKKVHSHGRIRISPYYKRLGPFAKLATSSLLLMIFRTTRVLGGISLYLLTFFFGFSLWFYSLMVSSSFGPVWVIGGLLLCGVGVIITSVIAAAIWGQWTVAGGILLTAVLIYAARMFGWAVAEKQLERDDETRAA
jgi:hypothetical protein